MSPEAKPLSIGVVVGSVSREAGGLFNSVRRSAMALTEAGCQVSVYGLEDGHSRDDVQSWRPLAPKVFPTRGPRRLGYAPALGDALLAGSHDVVHLHGLWQLISVQAARWRRTTGKPVMLSPRGMLDPWALRNSGLKKRLAAQLFEADNLRRAACLHALNPAEAEAMRGFGLTNPIAVIPNGADIPDATPRPPPGWMAGEGRRTLLFLGRIHPKKGLAPLIEAWARLKAEAPLAAARWRLAIAGWDDGGHLEELRRLVGARSLQDDVVFPGPLFGEVKAQALTHAGAFVLPSLSEGLPMAVLEAWSYELPVFMTPACNLSEAFDDGAAIRIGVVPEALALQLLEGLSRPDLVDLGRRGGALARARYAWGSIAEAHLEVYRWMRDGGEAPACVLRSAPVQALPRRAA